MSSTKKKRSSGGSTRARSSKSRRRNDATTGPAAQGEEEEEAFSLQPQKLLTSWESFVVVLSFLPSVKPVRLVSKAHRAAVDGFLLVERGKVPLFPPLGFQSDMELFGQDVYALSRFGEEAWRASRTIGWAEYRFLSSSLKSSLMTRAKAWNKMNEVDLDMDLLPPMPPDLVVPQRKLYGWDVYAIRKYGVEAWKAERSITKYMNEYHRIPRTALNRLREEANSFNEQHAIQEFQAPPLPPDFNPGCHLTAYDVYVIRKHMGAQNFRSSSWWNCKLNHAKFTWRKEYDRLSISIHIALRDEANAVNERYKPDPTPLPPPLPSSFRTNKYLTGTDLYTIRKLGPEIWQSERFDWSVMGEEYNALSLAHRESLHKEAEELNKRNEITPKDLAAKFTITEGDGAVCQRKEKHGHGVGVEEGQPKRRRGEGGGTIRVGQTLQGVWSWRS